MTNLYISIVGDGDSNDQSEKVRELIDGSELNRHVKGEFVQCSLGHDPSGIFIRTAEEILEAKPDHPETGFKSIAERSIARARNPVGAYVVYEPGQGLNQPDRFDTGMRQGPYRHTEIALASRCIEQLRKTSTDMGYEDMLCGFYNLPSGMGDRANAPALRGIYYTAGMDYSFVNMNWTRGYREDYRNMLKGIRLRKSQFAPLGNAAPNIIAWTMSRDNSFDGRGNYPLHWVDPKAMRAKGRAVKQAGVDLVLWLNEGWFENKENIQPIVDGFNELGVGLNGYRRFGRLSIKQFKRKE